MKEYRCCFTGHRPNKIGFSEQVIKELLENAIDEAIENGYVTFISGMAMGTDIWAAEIILSKKKMNKNLHLICALPHPGFEKRRSITEKLRFEQILKNADLIVNINNSYFNGCYQVRNEWMVDRSSLVIAVFNGQKSGTKNTIDYARKRGVLVKNVLKIPLKTTDIPNAETIAAMKEIDDIISDKIEAKKYESVDEIFNSLNT